MNGRVQAIPKVNSYLGLLNLESRSNVHFDIQRSAALLRALNSLAPPHQWTLDIEHSEARYITQQGHSYSIVPSIPAASWSA